MRAWHWAALGGVVGLAYFGWKVQQAGSLQGAASSISEGVLNVVYAVNGDSRANEEKYAGSIAAAESRYGLPAGLLHRQLYQESRYRSDIIGVYPDDTPVPDDKRTVSVADARGIAQIVPRWHPNVDPWNPLESIDYAARFMAQLYRQFGSWQAALAAYNWGAGNVSKSIQQNGALVVDELPTETRNYVTQITSDVEVA